MNTFKYQNCQNLLILLATFKYFITFRFNTMMKLQYLQERMRF